jgi:hypothetical protein
VQAVLLGRAEDDGPREHQQREQQAAVS